MPTPKNATRTLAEVREECRLFGVQPGRSIAESEARIAAEKRVRNARDEAAACDRLIAKRQDEDAFEARLAALGDAVTHGTGIVQVVTPGDERHVKFAEAFHGGYETEVGADGVRRVTGTYTEAPDEPEAKRAEADRVAEKTARHAMAFRSGASLFLAAAAALGPVPRTSPDLREMASSFDRAARNRPRASVPGSVRRKMQREAAKNGG